MFCILFNVYLENILSSLNETSILSRVVRAFANLSLDYATAQQIVHLDVVPMLVKLLSETADLHFKQNIIRALRIIGKIVDGKKEVVDCNGLQLIIELLRSENMDIRRACLQSLQELTKAGDRLVAEQIQEHCAIEPIIEMTYSEDESLRKIAILTLSYITANASVRVSVGTIGGIEAFINQIQKRSTKDDLVLAAIEGVCMCCREAVNRNKVRSCGGLEVLLEIFRCPEYARIYDRILAAFVCFVFDELALNRLIANGIIPALISYLQQLLDPLAGKGTEDKVITDQHESEKTTKITHVPDVKPNVISKKSSTKPEFRSKPVLEPNFCKSRGETMSCWLDRDCSTSVTMNVGQISALSPTSSLSPSCSPEHHLSYMSPLYLQSARDGAFSPMVYSPCGSDVDNDDSLEESISEKSPGNDEEHLQEKNHSNAEEGNEESRDEVSVLEVSIYSQNTLTVSGNEDSHDTVSVPGNENSHNESLKSTNDTTVRSGEAQTPDKDDCVNLNAVEPFLSRSSENSTPHPAIPFLPGASLSDHFHMFLPKENLFSADLPSPKKSEIPVMPRTRRVRRNLYLDTPSIGRPGYTPCSPVSSSSFSGQRDVPERNIFYLLSRFAQMPNPPEELIALSCIQTLMDYLTYSLHPDPRCARLLSRLTWNVNCFETLVLNMLPGAFYRQLACGFGPGYHLGNATESSNFEPDVNVELSVVNAEESRRMLNESMSTSEDRLGKSEGDKEAVTVDVPSTNGNITPVSAFEVCAVSSVNQSASSSPSKTQGQKRGLDEDAEEDEHIAAIRFPPSRTKQIEDLLLSNMSTQACTSFGKGQLAHLLLRGSQKQKRACALSLPYLCR